MSPNFQPADVARAETFYATIFRGRGKFDKVQAETLAAAREARDAQNATAKNGHRSMVYMIVDGRSELVPDAFDPANPDAYVPAQRNKTAERQAAAKKGAATRKAKAAKPASKPTKAAAKAAAAQAKRAARVARKAKPEAKPAGGKRAAILADAEAGNLPAAPDFSAKTHERFRGKLAKLIELAEAGDLAALKAFPINPISSSPKALDKYRNLAVIALEARAAK